MTSVASLLADSRNHLVSSQRDALNVLAVNLNASVTEASTLYGLGPIGVGSYVEIDTEIMVVVDATPATNAVTVIRGMLGSTAATHATGAIIRVDPRFFDFYLLRAVNDELRDLSSPINGLYQVTAVTWPYDTAVTGYDLTGITDLVGVLDVRAETAGDTFSWTRVKSWEPMRGMATTDFPSGFAVNIFSDGSAGRDIRVWCAVPFDPIDETTSDVETTSGIPATAIDIVAMGAAIRAAAGREVGRGFYETQGDTRRAGEVKEGSQTQALALLRRLRLERIGAESARLQAAWPSARMM